MPQGPETRLLDAAQRARQVKLTTKQHKRLEALLALLERLLESPAQAQARQIVSQPASHSGQIPEPVGEFANTQ